MGRPDYEDSIAGSNDEVDATVTNYLADSCFSSSRTGSLTHGQNGSSKPTGKIQESGK